jgi:hypothetical protein
MRFYGVDQLSDGGKCGVVLKFDAPVYLKRHRQGQHLEAVELQVFGKPSGVGQAFNGEAEMRSDRTSDSLSITRPRPSCIIP